MVSGGADFGLNVATGTPVKQAGINAGIGAIVGLGAFGVGHAFNRGVSSINKQLSRRAMSPNGYSIFKDGIPIGRNKFQSSHPMQASKYKEFDWFIDQVDGKSRLNVRAHGSKSYGRVTMKSAAGQYNDVNIISNAISRDVTSDHQVDSIRLLVCYAGKKDFAQNLANKTQLPVTASKKTVWGRSFDKNGKIWQGKEPDPGMGSYFAPYDDWNKLWWNTYRPM